MNPKIEKEVADSISDSKSAALRIRDIVANLMKFSMSGKDEKQAIDLNRELDLMLELFLDYRQDVSVSKQFGNVAQIFGHPLEVKQAILNVIWNGVYAIEEKAKISAKTIKAHSQSGRRTLRKKRSLSKFRITASGLNRNIFPKYLIPFSRPKILVRARD